jgi:DNA replication protein DnaC
MERIEGVDVMKTPEELLADFVPGKRRRRDKPFLPPLVGKTSNVPRRTLKELDTGHAKIKLAVTTTYAWAERVRNGATEASIVLSGPPGTGKTHIAQAILWSMTQAAISEAGEVIPNTEEPCGRFYIANDLIQKLEPETRVANLASPGFGVGTINWPGTPLVVVDDVGREQNIPYISNQVQEIKQRYFKFINHCYTWRIGLVMTTNLSLPEFARHIGPAAWDRLCEMAPKGFMLSFEGVPSWRFKTSGRAD